MLRPLPGLLRAAPWLTAAAGAWFMLHGAGVPHGALGRYALYFGGCVALPGTLLLRALWRSTGSWALDLGLGSAAGLVWELAGWAMFTTLGWQRWLVCWPALVLIVFAAVPALRRHWRTEGSAPPVGWAWAVAAAVCWTFWYFTSSSMGSQPPPPAGIAYHTDLLFHLSIVHELGRTAVPQVPQVAGEPLQYHWLPDAHLAAAARITGLPPELVLFRCWVLPVVAAGLLAVAALARQVSRNWWSGPVALAMTALIQYADIWTVPAGLPIAMFEYLSPSQTYGVLLGVVAAVLLVDLLTGKRPPVQALLLTGALVVVGGGAKPTTLPLLLGGTGLAGLFVLVRDRRARRRFRVPARFVVIGALLVAAAVVTMATLTGGTGGSRAQLFAIARLAPNYPAATGDRGLPAMGGWILASLRDDHHLAVWGGLVVVASVLVSSIGALAGSTVVGRPLRATDAAWWLAGALTAGWLGFLLLDHPSASQGYFIRSAMPIGAAAAAWVVCAGLAGRPARVVLAIAAGAVVAGIVLVLLARLGTVRPEGGRPGWILATAVPIAVLGGLAAVLVAGWLLVRRRAGLAGTGIAAAVLVVVGLSVPANVAIGADLLAGGFPAAGPLRVPKLTLTADEQRAARWLALNSAPADVVATNTACLPARPPSAGCDARGYLVSGIGGRRTLLEGWAYTEQARAWHGRDGLAYQRQPAPWPDRVELAADLLARPTPALARRARDEYGVRWVLVDLRGGRESARLGQVARLRYAGGRVRIYELAG